MPVYWRGQNLELLVKGGIYHLQNQYAKIIMQKPKQEWNISTDCTVIHNVELYSKV